MKRRAARRAWLLVGVGVAVTVSACTRSRGSPEAAPPDRFTETAMLAEGARYLDDASFRKSALAGSLTNPANTYSRQRLTSYGLVTRGWDILPEWNPRSVVLTAAMAEGIRAGKRPSLGAETGALWDGTRPTTRAGWEALGREVFFRYPLRREVYVEWAVAHPDEGARVGVRAAGDGTYPGAVAFVDTRGESQVGMTCAICHADLGADGQLVVGQARRAFDYGALRLAYHAATGVPVDADLARRMRTWGPRRADVTEDDDEDPVRVPDLWGLRHQDYLTQAGTIKHTGAAALAIRQETQLLTSNHQTVRPPRELAFALAMYVYSLKPPPPKPASDASAAAAGRAIFRRQCATCHSNAAGGGDLVSAASVDTDPALANGGARGTAHYRTPALLGVASAGTYFHHGAVSTLDEVLSPARLDAGYAKGVLGPGAVRGHRYGLDLAAEERAALLVYLGTL